MTKFYSAFHISQCLGAIDGTHIEIEQPFVVFHRLYQQERPLLTQMFKLAVTTSTASWTLYWSALVACADTRIFANSTLNEQLMYNSPCPRHIVDDEEPISVFLLRDPGIHLCRTRWKNMQVVAAVARSSILGSIPVVRGMLSSAHLADLSRLGARAMDINLNDLPNVIYACFVFHKTSIKWTMKPSVRY